MFTQTKIVPVRERESDEVEVRHAETNDIIGSFPSRAFAEIFAEAIESMCSSSFDEKLQEPVQRRIAA